MATMGNSSPTAPAASTYRPNLPRSMSLSCRIGSKVPSAVVVSARPIGTKSCTKPNDASTRDGADGQQRADGPADHGHPAGSLPEQPRVQLVAGEQEQEPEADVRQQLDAAGVGQAEHVRPDQNAAEDEDHDLRNPRAGQHRDDDRCQGGDQHHREQGLQAPGIHVFTFPRAGPPLAPFPAVWSGCPDPSAPKPANARSPGPVNSWWVAPGVAVTHLHDWPVAVTPTFPSRETLSRLRFRPLDVAVGVFVILLIYAIVRVGAGARAPVHAAQTINLSPSNLPYYAARSLLRMFIALFFSYAFSLSYAYVAARSRRWRRVLVPALDILQSVPVLGFLAVTVTFFVALFPRLRARP